MAPRRPDRGVAPSAAPGPHFSSPAVDRTARRSLRDLLGAARALSSSPAGSPLRPGDQLQAAVEALKELCQHQASTTEKPALLRLLWEPAETRAALLRLHAQLLRVLASPAALAAMGTSERARHQKMLYFLNDVFSVLAEFNTALASSRASAVAATSLLDILSLALHMNFVPAICGAVVAAGLTDRQGLFHVIWTMMSFVPALYMGSLTAGESSARARDIAISILEAMAASSAMEHCMQAMVKDALARSVPRHPHQEVLSSSAAQFVKILAVTLEMGFLALVRGGGVAAGGGACGAESVQQHAAMRATAAIRAILSGPCLQYALAAHVVAQLAAADGGTRYGLAEEQTLPPVWEKGPQGSALSCQAVRSAPASKRNLAGAGLGAAVNLWSWCLEQSPPVPLLPYCRRAVHAMCLRLARAATSSAARASAERQPQQPASQQQQQLAVPLELRLCAELAVRALGCAVTSSAVSRQQPVPDSTQPGPHGSYEEWWGTAVPAMQMVVSALVEGWTQLEVSVRLISLLMPHVPPWPAAGDVPPSPPPHLGIALSAGCLPLLERAMRALQHSHEGRATCAAATAGAAAAVPVTNAAAHLSLLLQPACAWPLLGRLMAYGEPRQVAALLATSAKLIGRLSEGLREEQAEALSRSILSGDRAGPAADGGVLAVLGKLPLSESLRWLTAAAVERQQQDGIALAGDEQAAAEAAAAGSTAGAAEAEGGGVSTAAALLPPAGQVGLQNAVGEGSPPARAGLTASSLPVAGPSRQLASMIVFAARRWLPALSRLAMADGSTLAVGFPCGSEPAGLAAAGLVLPWLPALVHAAVQQEESEQGPGAGAAAPGAPDAASGVSASTPAACVSPAAWRLFLLADVDVVGLVGRTLQGLGLAGGAEGAAGGGAGPLFEAAVLHKACVALECVAAAFPREVAAALADGRLPPLHRAPEALLGGAASAQLPPEQRQQRERLLVLLSALGDGAAETSVGTSPATAAVPLPDPCVDGEGTAPASKVGAFLASAAAAGEWDALLPTCSNPLCASLAGGSEADLTLRACGGCGRPRYCCADCQRAHWRAGHKGECARRGR